MSRYGRDVAEERIAQLAVQGMDLVTFWRSCTEVLTPVMPHYMGPCWFTVDPASLLVTSHFQEGLEEIPPEWLAQEYYEDDFNKMAEVARSQRGVSTLHEATGGQPERSPRYQSTILAYGGDQEMLAGLRTPSGEVWGVLGLYREPGQALLGDDDQAFVKALAPSLAEGAGGRCWSARPPIPPIPRARTRQVCSCSARTGALSR